MNEKLYTPKELAKLFGVTTQTLQDWERNGKIKAVRTEGGHRRYIYAGATTHCGDDEPKKKYIYARVSSLKQHEDLQRQTVALQTIYPNFEVIQDIGSGINFKRRGLITLLDQVIGGNVSHVVVAHRDRLTRFGFELFQYLFSRFNVSIEVLSDDDVQEPITELAKDLLSIVTVFTARYYGSRSYKTLQKDKILPKQSAKRPPKPMRGRIKILLQQGHRRAKGERSQRTLDEEQAPSSGDAK
jgi:excisionase family DNA binding protein